MMVAVGSAEGYGEGQQPESFPRETGAFVVMQARDQHATNKS
jgi:hypothetical protein